MCSLFSVPKNGELWIDGYTDHYSGGHINAENVEQLSVLVKPSNN